jgi:hypothetical protein
LPPLSSGAGGSASDSAADSSADTAAELMDECDPAMLAEVEKDFEAQPGQRHAERSVVVS